MEPSTYVETTSHLGWQETMQSEMESIHKNGTWQLVDLPEGKKLITNKWIYKTKLGIDGHMEKLKMVFGSPWFWTRVWDGLWGYICAHCEMGHNPIVTLAA